MYGIVIRGGTWVHSLLHFVYSFNTLLSHIFFNTTSILYTVPLLRSYSLYFNMCYKHEAPTELFPVLGLSLNSESDEDVKPF